MDHASPEMKQKPGDLGSRGSKRPAPGRNKGNKSKRPHTAAPTVTVRIDVIGAIWRLVDETGQDEPGFGNLSDVLDYAGACICAATGQVPDFRGAWVKVHLWQWPDSIAISHVLCKCDTRHRLGKLVLVSQQSIGCCVDPSRNNHSIVVANADEVALFGTFHGTFRFTGNPVQVTMIGITGTWVTVEKPEHTRRLVLSNWAADPRTVQYTVSLGPASLGPDYPAWHLSCGRPTGSLQAPGAAVDCPAPIFPDGAPGLASVYMNRLSPAACDTLLPAAGVTAVSTDTMVIPAGGFGNEVIHLKIVHPQGQNVIDLRQQGMQSVRHLTVVPPAGDTMRLVVIQCHSIRIVAPEQRVTAEDIDGNALMDPDSNGRHLF